MACFRIDGKYALISVCLRKKLSNYSAGQFPLLLLGSGFDLKLFLVGPLT